MITINEFKLTRKEFFKVLIENYFRKRWWWFILFYSVGITDLFYLGITNNFHLFIAVFLVFYPAYVFIYFYRYVRKKQNQAFFINQKIEIDDDYARVSYEDGSSSEIKRERFQKLLNRSNGYLVYLNLTSFIYIPFRCFESENERNTFESYFRDSKG